MTVYFFRMRAATWAWTFLPCGPAKSSTTAALPASVVARAAGAKTKQAAATRRVLLAETFDLKVRIFLHLGGLSLATGRLCNRRLGFACVLLIGLGPGGVGRSAHAAEIQGEIV